VNTVSVDHSRCNGSANCALICPEVFELDEDLGKSTVIEPNPGDDLLEWVQQAVDKCPTQAISLTGAG